MQRFHCVRFLGALSLTVLASLGVSGTAAAQHGHGHGGHHHHHGGYGGFGGYGGYGAYGGFSIVSPGFGAFYGPGYASYGWGGSGLNYYRGPIGGYITPPVYSGYPGYSYFNPGFGLYGPAGAAGLPVAYPTLPPTPPFPSAPVIGPPVAGAIPRVPVGQAQVDPVPRQTNAEAKMRSLRVQAQGDEWFQKQNFLQAQSRYKQAIAEAPDRAEPHFRLGFSLAALGYYAQAAAEFKRGMSIDPRSPETGEKLDRLYGDRNGMAKTAMLTKAALWVQEDVRDPDRLFVMGVLLHFNDDPARSQPFLKAASQVTGSADYVQAFLRAQAQGPVPGPDAAPVATPDAAPVPLPDADDKPVSAPVAVLRAPRLPPRATVPPAAAAEEEESGPVLIVPGSNTP